MVPEPYTVLSKRQDTADTWTLELAAPSGEALAFSPGQFTMLSAGGCGEVPISISGDPDRPERLIHTVRSVGLATAAICATAPGDTLSVRGPFGGAWPVADLEGSDVLIAAGGIGLAPLRPAILWLLARRKRHGRLIFLYGGRDPRQLLYTDEVRSWEAQGLEVHLTVDSAGPEWLGHVGVVTRLVRLARPDPKRTVAMCCGPEVMMRFTVAALGQGGVPAERIHGSLERNMQCGIGHCGHCQLGPTLICRDGPVYRWSEIERWLSIREM
ncbi:MAG: FAD/NAD(P)-binding protein [Solirubrobacteraceae bacterium]